MSEIQPHIKCKKGDVAKYVLCPGDPGRIERIIKYWDEARKIAFNREFLTYTGKYKGIEVSATSTGIGGPSTAIAVEELVNVGAKVLIRVGTCGSLRKDIKIGDIIIPIASMRQDGTSRDYFPIEFPAVADLEVTLALIKAAQNLGVRYWVGINRTHDAFYETSEDFLKLKKITSRTKSLISSEMECSTLFIVALARNVKAGCVLAVNTYEPPEVVETNPEVVYQLDEEEANEGIENAIKVALEAIRILEKGEIKEFIKVDF